MLKNTKIFNQKKDLGYAWIVNLPLEDIIDISIQFELIF